MKIREFDIKNYDVNSMIRNMAKKSLTHVKFGGIEIEYKASTYNFVLKENVFDSLNQKTKKEIEDFFRNEHKKKSSNIIKQFNEYKKYSDKILFDDKDYNELLEVLEGNYYCQALTMVQDIVEAKTKGKSVKALKYQARKLQAENISCD